MPKFLIEWKGNVSLNSEDYANLPKITLSLLEMVKTGVKSNKITDWGAYCDLRTGYMIIEGTQDEIMPELLKYTPYVLFDVKPVINVDQAIEAVKAAQYLK
jgi:hypothetical protein